MNLIEFARRFWLGQRHPAFYQRLMGYETSMLKLKALTPREEWEWLERAVWEIATTTVVSPDDVASMVTEQLFRNDPRDKSLMDTVAEVHDICTLRNGRPV